MPDIYAVSAFHIASWIFQPAFFAHLQHSLLTRKSHLCLNTRSQYKVNDSAQQKLCAFEPHCEQTSVLTLCSVKATILPCDDNLQ